MIFDTFMFNDEADMLECRLTELADIPDLVHILVEADVTHGGNHPKPYRYAEHADRFDRWSDRIVVVQATDLPDGPDAWDREHAQREWVWEGLRRCDAQPDDIVMHGDVDEIPTRLAARFVNPRGVVVMHQRFHPFAVDWLHPDPWPGTTAAKVRNIDRMAALRDARLSPASQVLPDAGWHFSWVGDEAARLRKIDSFAHPEIRSTWEPHLEDCWSSGLHVDGAPLTPVHVIPGEWPTWIADGKCPVSWFRPVRTTPRPNVTPAPILGRLS